MALALWARRRPYLALGLLLVLFGAVRFVWLGDAPFINDEPRLLGMALEANRQGTLAGQGLMGSLGIRYGPLAVWFYQAALLLTRDPVKIVAFRVLAVSLVTGLSILWIARLLPRLSAPLGALAFLSPYLWFYSRQLWDNNFCIPLSSLAFASYLAFTKRPRVGVLGAVFLSWTFLFLTHLMALAVIVPMGIHFILVHRKWIARRWWVALLFAAGAAALSSGYLSYLAGAAVRPGPTAGGGGSGWLFPLLGGRTFSAIGLDYFLGKGWTSGAVLGGAIRSQAGAVAVSALSYALVWVGILLCGWRVFRAARRGEERDLFFHASVIALSALAFQVLLFGLAGTGGHPHYYNATWIFCFFFLWAALSDPLLRGWGWAAGLVMGTALAIVLADFILVIHVRGGTRGVHYGPTLANQVDVVKKIAAYRPDSKVDCEVDHWLIFPKTFVILNNLVGGPGDPRGPKADLVIEYADKNPLSGRIRVRERKRGGGKKPCKK